MGIVGYGIGLGLILTFQPYFPRRFVLDSESIAVVLAITVVICLAASTLGIRLALKIDPAEALSSSGRAMAETNRKPVVRIEHLSKYFGTGAARVDALRRHQHGGLSRPGGRADGPERLGQNHAAPTASPASWSRAAGGSRSTARSSMTIAGCGADLRRLRLDKVGFIFQYPNLLPFLDGTDNVAVVLDLAGYNSAAARERAVELLEYLEVGHRKHAMPSQLSGGEAQRVAIARALANRPRIILADEPTAPLNSARARIVMDLLRQIAIDQNAAIIVVTHDEMILDRFDHIFACATADWRPVLPLSLVAKPLVPTSMRLSAPMSAYGTKRTS